MPPRGPRERAHKNVLADLAPMMLANPDTFEDSVAESLIMTNGLLAEIGRSLAAIADTLETIAEYGLRLEKDCLP